MEKVYASLIIKGIKKINEVPKPLQKLVTKVLSDLGYEDLTKN